MSSIVNPNAFLVTVRQFPKEIDELALQTNIAYIDVAQAINNRLTSIYPTSGTAITGGKYYISTKQVQSEFRRVYSFTSTANIAHHINLSNIGRFSAMYGTFTDDTSWYGLIAGTPTAIAGQISFYVTSSDIVFVIGAGAPALTLGTIVLSWISPE